MVAVAIKRTVYDGRYFVYRRSSGTAPTSARAWHTNSCRSRRRRRYPVARISQVMPELLPQLMATVGGALAAYVAIRSDLAVLKERISNQQNRLDKIERTLYDKK